jgi:arginase family enzyme
MYFDFLIPVDEALLAHARMQMNQALGQALAIHTQSDEFPDLSTVNIALFGVEEGRGAIDNHGTGTDLSEVRKELYSMFPGNWPIKVADLGNIKEGNTLEDTYFVVQELISHLVKRNIIPVVIGGGQDLTYANYRAYDSLEQSVNLVCIDNRLDIGSIDDALNSRSYLSKIVMNQPNNLFNFSNIGYQTFFNSQDEIALIESLFFEAHRLGEVVQSVPLVEPVLRDADIVSIDISAVSNAVAPGNRNGSPNGFNGMDICTIARYAGISDKVSSFGIYEYNPTCDRENQTAQLIAQMIWYFIEGVNFRANDYPFGTMDNYKKYIVPIDEHTLSFYKSNKSGRWWMEISIGEDNKFRRHALIPCTYQDYLSASNQEIPDRWIRTLKKIV